MAHIEALTVVRLGLTGALQRTLRSTNAIENLNGSVERSPETSSDGAAG